MEVHGTHNWVITLLINQLQPDDRPKELVVTNKWVVPTVIEPVVSTPYLQVSGSSDDCWVDDLYTCSEVQGTCKSLESWPSYKARG